LNGDCWALVTGASRGVGLAAARALARLGCNLVLGARGVGDLQRVAGELSSQYGVEASARPLDLRSRSSVEAFVAAALEEASWRVGAAVISSGNPSCEPCTLSEATWWDWLEAAQLYVASAHAIMRALAEESVARPVRVILFSSWTAREPQRFLAVADVVRAGLPALVRLAAREWPGRLVPVLVALGSFPTPGALETASRIAERLGVEPRSFWAEGVEGLSPLRRSGRLEELEDLVAFLVRAPEYMAGGVVEFHGATGSCAC